MATRAQQFAFLLGGVRDPDTGLPLNGGTVKFYEVGTSTAKDVWTEVDKTNAYTEYTLDSNGVAELYGDGAYKIELYDSADQLEYTFDSVFVSSPLTNTRIVTSSTVTVTVDDDVILANTSANNITLNINDVSDFSRTLFIKKVHANNTVTIDPYSTQTIDSDSTVDLTDANETLIITPDTDSGIWRRYAFGIGSVAGLTATVSEINTACDGITATAAEINTACDGITATAAELNMACDGITATASEINTACDGITATASEINTACDGITATAAELNQLDGVTVGGSSSGDIVTVGGTQTLTNKSFSTDVVVGSASSFVQIAGTGSIDVCSNGGTPFIDFKDSSGDDYDCRITQISDGLYFTVNGGVGGVQALSLNSSGNVNIDQNSLSLGGTLVTASATEINTACSGITATAAELNQLDGVTVGGSSSGDIVTVSGTQTLTNKTISDNFRVGSSTNYIDLINTGNIEICNNNSTPFIDFKNNPSDDYDCRIIQVSDGLYFIVNGGVGGVQALSLNSSGNVNIDQNNFSIGGTAHGTHSGDVSGGTTLTIGSSKVLSSNIKTSQGEVSTTSTANLTLPGGEWGFFPNIRTSSGATACVANMGSVLSTSYVCNINIGPSSGSVTVYANQRYITNSGEVFWCFFLLDKTNDNIISAYAAPDHPLYGNDESIVHPFPDADLSSQKIVVVNPDIEQLDQMLNEIGGKYLLQHILEKYQLDMSRNMPWSEIPVTTGLDNSTLWFGFERSQSNNHVIKKRIPKPDFIDCFRLIKK